MKFAEQAQRFGARLEMTTVREVDFSGANKKVITSNGEYEARAVIIASGAHPGPWGCPGKPNCAGAVFLIALPAMGPSSETRRWL